MGGGIRTKVKRTNFVKHVIVETVPETMSSNLDAPTAGDEIDKQCQGPSSLPEMSMVSYKPQDPSSLPETSTKGSIPCSPRLGVIPKEKFQPLKNVVESDATKPHREGRMDLALLDDIITRLGGVSGYKQVLLTESEIRQLCVASREIFLEQPNLLELEAPIKICALIDDKILCMHGGLSPDLDDFDQIRNLPRPTDVPFSGLLCDLLWSDPSRDAMGWRMNASRGVSYTFGPDKVTEFLMKHDLDLICRGHQVVEDGYEFFANMQLVTIFSTPNYGGEYDNIAATMSIDETLICSFQLVKPAEKGRFTTRRKDGVCNTTATPS